MFMDTGLEVVRGLQHLTGFPLESSSLTDFRHIVIYSCCLEERSVVYNETYNYGCKQII